jgi:hypothetical protein
MLQFTAEERNTSVAYTKGMALAQKVKGAKNRKRKWTLSKGTHHFIDLEFIPSSSVVERLSLAQNLI